MVFAKTAEAADMYAHFARGLLPAAPRRRVQAERCTSSVMYCACRIQCNSSNSRPFLPSFDCSAETSTLHTSITRNPWDTLTYSASLTNQASSWQRRIKFNPSHSLYPYPYPYPYPYSSQSHQLRANIITSCRFKPSPRCVTSSVSLNPPTPFSLQTQTQVPLLAAVAAQRHKLAHHQTHQSMYDTPPPGCIQHEKRQIERMKKERAVGAIVVKASSS
ncbi:hypothetical protein IWX49DRAFT_101773 [Phyllosticta citricarpa]|uniref:Uncharacterized protein n=2 Tax=Phyllosticta TaxID=121621 RepID=A0ABR1MN41_9PEZI